jgi:hypothetical protein
MSSNLRSTSTNVGYFVMSGNTVVDGSDYGLYDLSAGTVFNNDGTVSTPAQLQYNTLVQNLFSGDDASFSTITFKDLGKTVYGAQLYSEGGASLQGVSDVRKVSIVSGATPDADRAYYVPLGTNLRNASYSTDDNGFLGTVNASVALIGKNL